MRQSSARASLLLTTLLVGSCASQSRLVSVSEGATAGTAADGGPAPAAADGSRASQARDAGTADGGAAARAGAATSAAPPARPTAPAAAAAPAAATAPGPHHPDPAGAVQRCNAAWRDASGATPAQLIPSVVKGCLDVYTAGPCRQGWEALSTAPHEQRPRALAQLIRACQTAYCANLPRAAARMCDLPGGKAQRGGPPLMVLWGELHQAILRYELGAAQLQHFLSNVTDPKLKALRLSLQGTPSAARRLFAADGSELVQPVVTITESAILLWSRSGLEGTLVQPRGVFRRVRVVDEGEKAKVPVFEYDALNRALLELVRKRWPDAGKRPDESKQIELQTRGDFPYTVVLEVMKNLQKVREVPGDPRPKELGQELFPHVQLSSQPGLAKPKREPRVRRVRRRPY